MFISHFNRSTVVGVTTRNKQLEVQNNKIITCCRHRLESLLNSISLQLPSTSKTYSSPVKCLEWPRGFQEVKVPRLHDKNSGWW